MGDQIKATFIGRLGQDPKLQTSASGITWLRLRCAVERGDAVEWIQVLVADSATQRLCAALRKGDPIWVEGRLWLSRWTGLDGKEQTGLSCAASTVERISTAKTEEAAIEAQAEDTRPPRRRSRHARRDWQAPL